MKMNEIIREKRKELNMTQEQLSGSVRLHIRFKEEIKMIDQKWLLRTKYQKQRNRG